jgi:hypothetical protein
VDAHLRALMTACWRLGGLPELDALNLRAWAHTLGYQGHVLTKSRQYSTTYGALRAVRADHQSGGGLALEDRDTVTESAWRYVGSGHSPAESDIAVGIAEGLAALREIRRDMIAEGWKYAVRPFVLGTGRRMHPDEATARLDIRGQPLPPGRCEHLATGGEEDDGGVTVEWPLQDPRVLGCVHREVTECAYGVDRGRDRIVPVGGGAGVDEELWSHADEPRTWAVGVPGK